jgi:hypothetical protein
MRRVCQRSQARQLLDPAGRFAQRKKRSSTLPACPAQSQSYHVIMKSPLFSKRVATCRRNLASIFLMGQNARPCDTHTASRL